MNNNEINDIIQLLKESESSKYFGDITFKFRNGEIYQIEMSQSLKLENLRKRKR